MRSSKNDGMTVVFEKMTYFAVIVKMCGFDRVNYTSHFQWEVIRHESYYWPLTTYGNCRKCQPKLGQAPQNQDSIK